MLGGGTSRCLWLGGDGATSPMEKQACKGILNCYGKSNINVINENSTEHTPETATAIRMCSFNYRQYHYCHPTIGRSHPQAP
jgi:hypothetical protein